MVGFLVMVGGFDVGLAVGAGLGDRRRALEFIDGFAAAWTRPLAFEDGYGEDVLRSVKAPCRATSGGAARGVPDARQAHADRLFEAVVEAVHARVGMRPWLRPPPVARPRPMACSRPLSWPGSGWQATRSCAASCSSTPRPSSAGAAGATSKSKPAWACSKKCYARPLTLAACRPSTSILLRTSCLPPATRWPSSSPWPTTSPPLGIRRSGRRRISHSSTPATRVDGVTSGNSQECH